MKTKSSEAKRILGESDAGVFKSAGLESFIILARYRLVRALSNRPERISVVGHHLFPDRPTLSRASSTTTHAAGPGYLT